VYTVESKNRAASLQGDIQILASKGLLKKTVFVVRASHWPAHIENKDITDAFERVKDYGTQWELFVRHQLPRTQGKSTVEIWKEIYEKACKDHKPQGCLPRSCKKISLSKRKPA